MDELEDLGVVGLDNKPVKRAKKKITYSVFDSESEEEDDEDMEEEEEDDDDEYEED